MPEWLQNVLDILTHNRYLRTEWVYTLLWIPAVALARRIWLKMRLNSHADWDLEHKRRAMVVSRNVAVIAGILGLFLVWANQIQTFALSMVALAAATVVATKELVMCLSGSLLRALTRQYAVGDYIEINGLRGRVIDINPFNTLMMQIGPDAYIGNSSGKTVSFPNSLLLGHAVQRDSVLGRYVVHTFDIPVPIHLDSDAIVARLAAVLDARCKPFEAEIAAYFEAVQVQKLFFTPAARVRISRVPHDDKTYRIVIRFASPVAKRLEIQQAVLDEFIRVQFRLLNPQN